jgi:protoporphyrinogen oxidase
VDIRLRAGRGYSSFPPANCKGKFTVANYVIVGAGASGLYTAFHLLKSGKLQPSDTVQIFEWSQRPGGRIFTYSFPDPPEWEQQGLYVELGGMRFAADAGFPILPHTQCEGHVLVQSMILQLGLQDKVRDFQQSKNRLYYCAVTRQNSDLPVNQTDELCI